MEPQEDIQGRTAAVFARNRFGGPTRPAESRVNVGTSVTPLIGNNPRRVFWMAVNRTPNEGALGLDPTLTFANGILLGPNGGFASMAVEEDGEAVGYAVFAIQNIAGGTWYVLEVMQV